MRMKKTSRKQLRTLRRRRLALALVGAMAMPMMPAMAQNLPESGTVVSGSATIGSPSTTLVIDQTSQGAIIDWGSFSIGSGYGVTFNQPNASAVILNRVVSALGPGYAVSPTQIDGTLSANGHVFIINPAGVTFGNDAQVNVGGLLASTLWMNSGDFIAGLTSGQFVFTDFNGDTSATHQVRNNGTIIAGAGGVGLVGRSVWNNGSITSNGGNIIVGAGTQVTVDMVGDGLTQVTINVPPTVDSQIIQDRFGSMTADGGKILLRTAATAGGTGGEIFASGTLRAQSIANVNGRIELTSRGGPVMVGAPGTVSDASTLFTQGSIDVSGGASETGGSVLIQGNGVSLVNEDDNPFNPTDPLSVGSMINATGVAGGGRVDIQSTAGVTMFGLSRIIADSDSDFSTAGQVGVSAVGAMFIQGDISAASKSGNGGSVSLLSTTDNLFVLGTVSATGADNGGAVSMFATNGDLEIGGVVSASGGAGNGGQIAGVAQTITLNEDSQVSADGGLAGGLVGFRGTNTLAAYGLLSAHGGTAGGSIVTAAGDTFDIRGLSVDAGSDTGTVGSWVLSAPTLTVVNGAVDGSVGSIALGSEVQDAELNYAFLTGTSVVLQSANDVYFDGAQIVADNALPLSFTVNAEGGISGNAFSITSLNGSLDMVFNADATSLSTGFAGIDFSNATLDSNGGNIAMYGQSDPVAGAASNYATGISLTGSTITTGGGNVLIRGASTGDDAGSDDAGVVLNNTTLDAGAGAVAIYGTGGGVTSGVILGFSDITAGAGGALLDGQSTDANGLFAYGSDIVAAGGDISLTGIGGAYGVDFDGGLYSYGGDIVVHGEGGTAAGVDFSGPVDSAGGNITIYGSSADATGLEFGGGYYSGMISVGGDISLTGHGATGGVALYASYGSGPILFAPGDVDEIDSGGGGITITGTASAVDAVGVYLDGMGLVGGAGDVTVNGSAPLGVGVLFANGAGISTTTGAITLIGTGADFGLDIADGALDTVSGDISLDGTATAADAVAGVRVTGDGLATDGGDITITGSSVGGVGVQLGAGGAFALDSGGGDIDVYGYSATAEGLVFNGGFFEGISSDGGDIRLEGVGVTGGAVLIGSGYGSNSIDSAGGLITIIGTASATDAVGVLLSSLAVVGGSGDVRIDGTSPAGIGVLFQNGASVSTTTGAIGLYGTGADFGLDIADGALDTDSGDITLEGTATAATATAGVRVTGAGLTTNGGDITVTGTSAGGVGVQLGDGGAFAIGSGGGAITIEGTGIDAGVLMQANQVTSGGGAVSITGTGTTTGVSLDGSDIDSAGGNIDVQGEASGSGTALDLTNARLSAGAGDIRLFGDAALGTGVNFGGQSGVTTTTGDISITGIGASIGLDLAGGELSTDSGHIDLRGRGVAAGAIGLRIGQGVSIATDGGGIELSGEGNAAAGLVIGDGASVDGGDSLVVLRATSTSPTDTIDIRGSIHSGVGVNLRPGGVDLQGGLTEATADSIYLGSGTGGFVLSNAELALIDTPDLIIGSNLHAGAIQVLGGISREGNLTLQNGGGTGGIAIQAGLDVGDGTLALSSGGSITQTSAGVINAHSLLAQAGGDVLLATALNDVANTTLAGSAGGDFEFQDANTLAIGSVSAMGFDASSGQLSSFASTGIAAGGDAYVRNLQGDMTLNAGVTATNIDLVTAGRLQNVAGASLVASGDWRVWASTWEGETRGGLAGDGSLPNLYGCAYLGACGVTVPGVDNHFIYVQQPIALISFDNATREYGLPNPLFTFSVTGAILGDTAANVAAGSATTTATIGSDVGNYAITGNFLSAAGYRIQFVPGTLAITPATLLFTADGAIRYLGFPNPDFTGSVTGFRNGDTVASVFGNTVIWSSPAGSLSPIGYYPVIGGTTARNYVFAQAPGNATALQVIPLPQLPATPIEFIRETINTYVYDRNFGGAPVCAVNASIDDTGLASSGDGLSAEWTKVRSRPNLTNCFDSERENGCGNF
jgi:filamentous hemagglutinin family protein